MISSPRSRTLGDNASNSGDVARWNRRIPRTKRLEDEGISDGVEHSYDERLIKLCKYQTTLKRLYAGIDNDNAAWYKLWRHALVEDSKNEWLQLGAECAWFAVCFSGEIGHNG